MASKEKIKKGKRKKKESNSQRTNELPKNTTGRFPNVGNWKNVATSSTYIQSSRRGRRGGGVGGGRVRTGEIGDPEKHIFRAGIQTSELEQ